MSWNYKRACRVCRREFVKGDKFFVRDSWEYCPEHVQEFDRKEFENGRIEFDYPARWGGVELIDEFHLQDDGRCFLCSDKTAVLVVDRGDDRFTRFCFDCLSLLMDWYKQNARLTAEEVVNRFEAERADFQRRLSDCETDFQKPLVTEEMGLKAAIGGKNIVGHWQSSRNWHDPK